MNSRAPQSILRGLHLARCLPRKVPARAVHLPPGPRMHDVCVSTGPFTCWVKGPIHWVASPDKLAVCPVGEDPSAIPDRGLYFKYHEKLDLGRDAASVFEPSAVGLLECLPDFAVGGFAAARMSEVVTDDGTVGAYEFSITLRLESKEALELAFRAPASCWRGCWIAAGQGMITGMRVEYQNQSHEFQHPWLPLKHVPRPRIAVGGRSAAGAPACAI